VREPFPPAEIETPRLVLLAARPAHAPDLLEVMDDSLDGLRPWIDWANKPFTLAELEDWGRRAEAGWAERRFFEWQAFTPADGRLVASVDLHTWDWTVPRAEVGYWGRTPDLGRGLVTEAVVAVCDVAFRVLGAERLQALCDARNLPSCRLAERAGFVREGLLRRYERDPRGELCDQVLYAKFPPG
jgi:RimJ/RimL family protein N-acetyltransferase